MRKNNDAPDAGAKAEEPDLVTRLVQLLTIANQKARRILADSEALTRHTEEYDELVDEIVYLISELIAAGVIPYFALKPDCTISIKDDPIARDLHIKSNDDGSLEFRFKVDFPRARFTFQLGGQPGLLLDFLCGGKAGTDGLAGWRSKEESLEFVAKISKTANRKRFLNGLLNKLRKTLKAMGLPHRMIQYSKNCGWRFRTDPPKREQIPRDLRRYLSPANPPQPDDKTENEEAKEPVNK